MGPTYRRERLTRLSELERWHFWFVGRRALVDRLLDRHLAADAPLCLDLGCGTGLMVEVLTRKGLLVVGADRRPEGLMATRRALPQAWLVQTEATQLPIRDGVFDAVMLLDVLEHVDDRSVLCEVHRVLKPGGLLLLTVPAMPWLWSYRDEAAGHLRRYRRQDLRRLLASIQFRVEDVRYYQCLFLPLAALVRLGGRTRPQVREWEERPTPVLNRLMAEVNRLEAILSDTVRWPWGSSLAVACTKA